MMFLQLDFTAVPPPHAGASHWWPTIAVLLNLATVAIGGVWVAWLTFKTKQAERIKDTKEAQTQLRVESMRLENDRQKDFQESLMSQCKELMEETSRTRESLSKAHTHLVESHAQINDQQLKAKHQADEIIDLRDQVRKLEGKIERLEKHVAKLEQCSAKDRDTKIDIEIQ